MDRVVEDVEKVKKEFQETENQLLENIKSIQEYGKSRNLLSEEEEHQSRDSLPRLNGIAQDGLNLLESLQFKLDLLAPQLPSDDQVQQAQDLANSWKKQIKSFRISLRNANMQAKENIKKTAQQERELLLGGGEESTIRRRNLQSHTGSLRRTRQLMVQEVERNASTLTTFEESTEVLRKAETDYRSHRSLLMRTRNLLSTMQRQDVIDRVILIVGFLLFSLAVLYVVSKRIGLLTLQRKLMDAVKAGTVKEVEILPRAGRDGVNIPQVMEEAVPVLDVPQELHDEL